MRPVFVYMEIILIAATTADGYIARHSHEEVRWSKDLSLFKEQTMGHPVIMGSHTFESLQKELIGREIIVVHRDDQPINILDQLSAEKCFIAGGGRTNTKFIDHLTHLYLTPHPYIFGKGVSLFYGDVNELELELEQTIELQKGIIQYQYRVIR